MNTLLALLLAAASGTFEAPESTQRPLRVATAQDSSGSPRPGAERIVIQKDGGPGHGPDQPYSVREQGAKDLEGFVGGKQVVFVEPYDVFVVTLIVVLVVVLIIIL